ncbi:spore coat protein A [Pilimelia terevasa]|uniref:Spore coat protein A n=1 Tax=Pilimelia terevasa TaxID=53372 RepID=A0A8J3BV73_9ACTN|nr:multicopper oxidase family protein [Pilimelia terevasa]GGK33195.1 spore coat protein A [Pilimelia terevasa]
MDAQPQSGRMNRRDILRWSAAGALTAAAATAIPLTREVKTATLPALPASKMPKPYTAAFVRPPVLKPYQTGKDQLGRFARYTISQRPGVANLVPNLRTPIYAYNGIFPGPVIELDQGVRAYVRMRNKLPANHPRLSHPFHTSTHLHGSASMPQYDGYANDITMPGYYKEYRYPNFQPARTLWYHDHGVHHTAENVYSGLAAFYLMHDPAERALLPQGEFDVPLMVNDIMLAADGAPNYNDRTHSGLWGDIILVNGQPWPVMKVKRRVYRFRVLNASISRSYRFQLSTGDPVTMVATDGGLMPVAQQVGSWRHGSAERYEILIDFRKYKAGQRIELRNLSNKNNVDFANTGKVMAFDVVDDAFTTVNNKIPTTLVGSPVMKLTEAQSLRSRRLEVERKHDMWTINGKTWHDVGESGFRDVVSNPDLNDVELWEIENKSGGWFHPVHIHLIDFQILSRNGAPAFPWERGPKDVVYVGEGETVRLLMRFEHQKGKYMIHCHNLPHEDHDMMQQFSVGLKAGAVDVNDPINAAKAVKDTLPPWA